MRVLVCKYINECVCVCPYMQDCVCERRRVVTLSAGEFYGREKEGGLHGRREVKWEREVLDGFEGDRFECGFGSHFLVYT